MTQEYKELLLNDLCTRLPYGVIVETPKGRGHVCNINLTIFGTEVGVNINATSRDKFNIEDIKPYLFPLSNITEEQKNELRDFYFTYGYNTIFNNAEFVYLDDCIDLIDWLNKNHFDYRGLIKKGLAIDATNLNIY